MRAQPVITVFRRAAGALTLALAACATAPPPDHKAQVVALLKSLETGDTKPVAAYVDPNKYIQHNLAVADGVAGLKATLFALPAGSIKVNTVRVYQDGDFVFAHTDYDFFGPKVGFDVFRFENDKIVEHWDNLQAKPTSPSPSGHTMIDGPTVATDLDRTAANKALMQRYMEDLLQGRKETFTSYFDNGRYLQHSPLVGDNLSGLFAGLQSLAKQGLAVKYDKVQRILGEGDFVLVMVDGSFGGKPSAYYDFYRIENGKLAEHWDTIEAIPPRAEWKNTNDKF